MRNRIIFLIFIFFIIIEVSLCLIAVNITPVKLKRNVFTFQYGEAISTNVADYVIANDNIIKDITLNITDVSTEVGNYNASVSYFDKVFNFEIHIIDTIKPKAELKKVEWHILIGEEIYARKLIKNIEDYSKTTVYFYDEETKTKSESLSFSNEGSYIERILVEDAHGNQSAVLRVKIVVGKVDSKPTIEGVGNITIRKGESIDLLDGVRAIDVEDGDITSSLQVIGTIDVNTPGDYYITYIVSDERNNITTVIRTIHVE